MKYIQSFDIAKDDQVGLLDLFHFLFILVINVDLFYFQYNLLHR